jgi:hypothetical protein
LECRIYFCVHGITISNIRPNAKLSRRGEVLEN